MHDIDCVEVRQHGYPFVTLAVASFAVWQLRVNLSVRAKYVQEQHVWL